jgi:hypothetical protein
MNISIECLTASAEAARQVRQQVFEREWQATLPRLSEYDPERQLTLVARNRSNQEPIAVLTVLETTGDPKLHRRLGLAYFEGKGAARYTQLAVLKPYRGMNLPILLITEAQKRFVGPKQIRYTWLMFDAERARLSSLCNWLGFGASRRRFLTEYGCVRILTRDERSTRAAVCDRRTQQWLKEAGYDALLQGSHRTFQEIHLMARVPSETLVCAEFHQHGG